MSTIVLHDIWPLAEDRDETRIDPERAAPASDTIIAGGDVILRGALDADSRVGRYLLGEPLGEGGMGIVYKAHDPDLDRLIAIKFLHTTHSPGAQARLLREAQAMARLSHPNVATAFDVGVHDGRIFLAMELVDGHTLRTWLEREQRTRAEIIDMFLAVGRGLAAAHAVDIIHRDFKPDNVLVGNDGRPRVTDFGLAAQASEGEAGAGAPSAAASRPTALNTPLTQTGTAMGTPRYMAPEQHRGDATSAQTDQFAYCVALYHALYGEFPFDGDSIHELAAAVLDGQIRDAPAKSDVPARLRAILTRGLSIDPDDRFPSMDALLAELADDPAARRRRLALAGVLVVGVAALAVFAFRPQSAAKQAELCTGGEAKFATAWNGDKSAAVKKAFVATHRPDAETIFAKVAANFEALHNNWTAMYASSCRATRVEGDQSETMLERRTMCLDDALVSARSLADLLAAKPDARVVRRAIRITSGLADIAHCADSKELSKPNPPPQDPAARASLAALLSDFAKVRALSAVGHAKQALAAAQALEPKMRSHPYQALTPAFLIVLARLQASRAPAKAEALLKEAVQLAAAQRVTRAEAGAWLARLRLVSRRSPKQADALVDAATAAVARVGNDPAIAAELNGTLAVLYVRTGRRKKAGEAAKRALDYAETSGKADLKVSALGTLGRLRMMGGDIKGAKQVFEQAIELDEKANAGTSNNLPVLLNYVGSIWLRLNKPDKAEKAFAHSLELKIRNIGPDTIDVARGLLNVGELQRATKHPDKARESFTKALSIFERHQRPGHPDIAYALHALGTLALEQNQPEAAQKYLSRAVKIRAGAFKPGNPKLVESKRALAEAGRRLAKHRANH